MKHYLRTLRERFDRRRLALLGVFAIALTGTGISSLATINDQLDAVVNGSVTVIDLKLNGSKSITIDLPTGLTPGDYAYASLIFDNTASNGYAKIPADTVSVTGGQLATDSLVKVWEVPQASCNAASLDAAPFTGAQSLSADLWDVDTQLDAGNTKPICLQYRVGVGGGTYAAGNSTFSVHYSFPAYYP